ncbi:MAG: hypothetical protein AB7P03_20840 [Kofleriaceae bacterium]
MLKQHVLASVCVSALALPLLGCSDDDDDGIFIPSPGDDASLLVVNDSDFVIEQIYLAAIDDPSYGPNLLGGDVLFPGEQLELGVSCDFYDALVIDEQGVECELFGLDLCANDATWVINNNTCSVFAAAQAQAGSDASTSADTNIQ